MAQANQLPCDGDGICMVCKEKPSAEESLNCSTCATPWHVSCLADSCKPPTMADAVRWECPDCTCLYTDASVSTATGGSSALLATIRAIESDSSLSEQEKARRRQELLTGGAIPSGSGADPNRTGNDVIDIIDGSLKCSCCILLLDRPVTTPCGHNFCLKCFQKWVGQGKRTCVNCRTEIPQKMVSQPRINSALVMAIRMAKMEELNNAGSTHGKVHHFIHNQNRPDKAFTTERAKRAGKANACSGKIFVTTPPDHFGPITAEYDPERRQGVLVGECWDDRMDCRQWGAHLPHVAGIAGQSSHGAQSVCLSGGYQDDEDHGEWFLYTGSGGRDLTGNRRTNSTQSSEQKFEKMNEALRVSCKKGYPVRVVRSHKEKRSSYAPEAGVRYDGVYRIEKCWRKVGIQGFLVCRYLFVRCDNEPAPWASDEHGDLPRPMPVVKELKKAIDITERKGCPSWDYDEEKALWLWKKPPPISRKRLSMGEDGNIKRQPRNKSVKERLLREFGCQICRKVMNCPVTTPCAHNFCKACLEEAFAGKSVIRQRSQGRSLRAQKNIMKCPACTIDIAEFLQNLQVNRELMGVIESLQSKTEEEDENSESEEEAGGVAENLAAIAEDADCENLDNLNGESENSPPAETEKKANNKRKKCNTTDPPTVVDDAAM
ncbi:hypothetical protein SAY87_015704 [Trapa incisa]|uniref:RING-type E3 ubiquitin transferase n=1 Tax=Trapa incisa TaxID=236973 RepID=A0AAN7QYA5_9MYRT|nr:hypothetical protein SAY87_015704 [Trapa incisa]